MDRQLNAKAYNLAGITLATLRSISGGGWAIRPHRLLERLYYTIHHICTIDSVLVILVVYMDTCSCQFLSPSASSQSQTDCQKAKEFDSDWLELIPAMTFLSCFCVSCASKVLVSVQAICTAARSLSETSMVGKTLDCFSLRGQVFRFRGVFVDVHGWFRLCGC